MLEKLIPKNRVVIHDGFNNWQDAIKASCQPLIKDKSIEPEYPDYIIKNVEEFGPYIVIAPDICIPHAQEGKGVNKTCIGLMKTNKPVIFNEEDGASAKLFFVLASENSDMHINNLQTLVEYISDEDFVNKLLNATTIDEMYA